MSGVCRSLLMQMLCLRSSCPLLLSLDDLRYTVKKFMDKRLLVHIQGARKVTGTLRGFDIFLNLVLDQARDETVPGREERIEGGMVVSDGPCSKAMSLAERTCTLRS